jgi:hemoglobin/transferrin/lactoferrin receptor protein
MWCKKISLAFALGVFSGGVAAAEGAETAEPAAAASLPEVKVRGERAAEADAQAAGARQIGRAELDRAAAEDLSSATRYVPGVEVTGDPALGNGTFTIRGVGGDRVTSAVDGVGLPESFNNYISNTGSGGGSKGMAYGQNLIEFDTIGQMEIQKGPFGDQQLGRIGGQVDLRTYDPEDFVSAEKPWHAGLKQSYADENKGWKTTLSGALRTERAAALLMLTRRGFEETESTGPRLFAEDNKSDNVLFKTHLRLTPNAVTGLTAERFTREIDALDEPLNSTDQVQYARRKRWGLFHEYTPENGWLESLAVRYARQETEQQHRDHNRASGQIDGNAYQQDTHDWHAHASGSLGGSALKHQWYAGLDYRRGHSETDRSRIQNGLDVPQALRFPAVDKKVLLVTFSDRMVFANGVSLKPAIKYVDESSDPNAGDLARLNASAGFAQGHIFQSYAYRRALPSLELNVPVARATHLTVQYAKGYKMPQLDANGVMVNDFGYFKYGFLPNPKLKSEASDNWQMRLQARHAALQWNLTGFYNRYRNYITETGINPEFTELLGVNYIFTPENRNRVRTYGLEGAIGYQLDAHWRIDGAFFVMKSRDDERHLPLETQMPPRLNLGLGYETGQWGVHLDWRFVVAKKSFQTDVYDAADGFKRTDVPKTASHSLVDLSGFWTPHPNLRLQMGIRNLFNKKYWDHQDMLWLAKFDQLAEKAGYAQPGRSFFATLHLAF